MDDFGIETISQTCCLRYQFLVNARRQKVKRLKRLLRSKNLRPMLIERDPSDASSKYLEEFQRSNDDQRRNRDNISKVQERTMGSYLRLINRRRELAIECIARQQLVNARNEVVSYIKKRFFAFKKNFKPQKCVAWVRDLPLRPNLNNQIWFDWKTLQLNRRYLHDLYDRVFKGLEKDFESLNEQTFTFKAARSLNRLAYLVNAIDAGEYNALNFVFSIYRRQNFDFKQLVKEISFEGPLPSPDPAVLHDNVFSVFTRINYFDYNETTGELGKSYDNALFVLRQDLHPFLVTECVLIRFLFQVASAETRNELERNLASRYEGETVCPNICQLYPGLFTLILIVAFEHQPIETRNILHLLLDIEKSATATENERVKSGLKRLSFFICETIYNIEMNIMDISETYRNRLASDVNFLSYSYLVNTPASEIQKRRDDLSNLPFLVKA